MTPADKRVSELLDRWIASLELHHRYLELDDEAYWQVQHWPRHDRPTRWIVELARQRALELKAHYESRRAMGDTRFAEALELTIFLATLVGLQNVERFIPLADPSREVPGVAPATSQTGDPPAASARKAATARTPKGRSGSAQPGGTSAGAAASGAERGSRPSGRSAPAAPAARPSVDAQATGSTGIRLALEREAQIIADAVRLLRWGRLWHELPELIGKLDGRPPTPQIRQVLQAQRRNIEREAGVKG